jgi:hypothetical protein
MNRRRYLAMLAAGASLAGCSGRSSDGSAEGETADGTESETATGTPRDGATPVGTATVPSEFELPIPRDELNRGAPKDRIPAIVDPAFASDWSDVTGGGRDLSLSAEDRVIGVERDGEARAYPLRVLNWHEVVNDDFAGPLLVTYCPLCGSGVTAERLVDGEVTRFGVSGLLWNSDLVMYDERTESLWSQLLGTAIRGPKTGTTLSFVPSSLTTWDAWRESHPDTEVLLPPPDSGTIQGPGVRDYARNPYVGYDENDTIGIGYNDYYDRRLHPKAMVIGVRHDGRSKAYPLSEIGDDATVNDAVGGLPVVVTTTGDGSLSAYERTVDDERLIFENDGPRHVRAGGSRWEKVSGRAVDGPYEGTTLVRANDRTELFWFAWVDFYPDTDLYRSDE